MPSLQCIGRTKSTFHKVRTMIQLDEDSNGQTSSAPEIDPSVLPAQGLRALIVDDEPLMCELMRRSLLRLGFDVITASNGNTALELLRTEDDIDVVLLDVLMPGLDGFTVCRELRTFSDIPVIMLTALNRLEDVVQGLEAGADNYITKPFNFREVEARIMAVLRRTSHSRDGNAFEVAHFGDLRLNNASFQATVGADTVVLTPIEFAVLRYLAARADRPVSKEELLEEVWGYSDADSDNLVELAVRRLRTKIEEDPSDPQRLITQRNVGYIYRLQPEL